MRSRPAGGTNDLQFEIFNDQFLSKLTIWYKFTRKKGILQGVF